jgi:hypothetical protein
MKLTEYCFGIPRTSSEIDSEADAVFNRYWFQRKPDQGLNLVQLSYVRYWFAMENWLSPANFELTLATTKYTVIALAIVAVIQIEPVELLVAAAVAATVIANRVVVIVITRVIAIIALALFTSAFRTTTATATTATSTSIAIVNTAYPINIATVIIVTL